MGFPPFTIMVPKRLPGKSSRRGTPTFCLAATLMTDFLDVGVINLILILFLSRSISAILCFPC